MNNSPKIRIVPSLGARMPPERSLNDVQLSTFRESCAWLSRPANAKNKWASNPNGQIVKEDMGCRSAARGIRFNVKL